MEETGKASRMNPAAFWLRNLWTWRHRAERQDAVTVYKPGSPGVSRMGRGVPWDIQEDRMPDPLQSLGT